MDLQVTSRTYRLFSMHLQVILHRLTGHTSWTYRLFSMHLTCKFIEYDLLAERF